MREIWAEMPADVRAKLPRDGASQIDHYVYGLPEEIVVAKVFADTFYWVALASPDDSSHEAAIAMDAGLTDVLIYTTDEVLVEFMTFYSADPWQRGRAATTVRRLMINPIIRVIRKRSPFLRA